MHTRMEESLYNWLIIGYYNIILQLFKCFPEGGFVACCTFYVQENQPDSHRHSGSEVGLGR